MITAPRFVSNTSTDIRRTDWKSRDQTDTIAANQLDATARFRTGAVAHALVTGVELSRESDENRTRIETGPAAPDTDLFHPNPDDPYIGGSRRTARRERHRAIGRRVRVRHRQARRAMGALGRRPLGLLRHRLRLDRRDRRQHAVRADRRHAQLARRRGVQAEAERQRLRRRRHVVQSVGRRPVAERGDGQPRAGEDAELRGRHEVGSAAAPALAQRRDLPHREDQRADARHQPGRSADRARGRQRVQGVETGAAGRLTSRWEIYGGYAFMSSEIRASNTPAELEQRPDADAAPHLQSLDDVPAAVGDRPVGGGVQFMDAVFRNTLNTTEVPSYRVLSAMAAKDVEPASHAAVQRATTWPMRSTSIASAAAISSPARALGVADRRLQVLNGPPIMLLQIPDVLTRRRSRRRARERLDAADWIDGRVTAGHQSARAKDNLQLPEDSPVARAARRRDPRGAAAQSALHLRGAAGSRLSAALQSLPGRPVVRQSRRQRDPAGPRHAGTASAPICRPRCSSPARTSTTAASWSSRTPTACTP